MDSVLLLDSYWPGAMKNASFQKGPSCNLEKIVSQNVSLGKILKQPRIPIAITIDTQQRSFLAEETCLQ